MRGRVLILAGTAEARAVCAAMRGFDVLASYAGATVRPADPGVPMRIGGFGGEAGFSAALDGVAAVLDATHPFASVMSRRAADVCMARALPHLRLVRRGWERRPGWTLHASLDEAAGAFPKGASVFLASGPGSVEPFLGRGLHLVCRRIDPAPPRDGVTWVTGMPSASVAEEVALLRAHRVEALVAKDSGGSTAKLDAAEVLGVAVHLIARPPAPPGEETDDIARAIAFVRQHAAHLD